MLRDEACRSEFGKLTARKFGIKGPIEILKDFLLIKTRRFISSLDETRTPIIVGDSMIRPYAAIFAGLTVRVSPDIMIKALASGDEHQR